MGAAPREIAPPSGDDAEAANLAVAADGTVWLSWLEPSGSGRHALRFARLAGDAWSEPGTIVEGGDFFVNWADFPSLVPLAGGGLAAHWLQRNGPGTYAYGVRLATSSDGGHTWSDPVVPHRDGTATEHGFVSLVPDEAGGLTAIWLDGRDFAEQAPSHGEGPSAAEMSLRATTLSAGGELGAEILLDPRICDCCQTSAARTSRGVLVVYRDRSEEEIRDISRVLLGDDESTPPATVHDDGWKIPGCPVNGPAVDASGDEAVVAWFTLGGGGPRVYVAFSSDGGASFGEPLRVDGGMPLGRVDVLRTGPGRALVSWLEIGEQGAELRLRPIRADGTADDPTVLATTGSARSSGFPRLVRSGDRLVLAWRDTTVEPARLRTVVTALPGPNP